MVGFILIATHPAKEEEVYNALSKQKSKLASIQDIYVLSGEGLPGEGYNLMIKVDEKPYKLGEFVSAVRKIPGVVETKTWQAKGGLEKEIKQSGQSANSLNPQQALKQLLQLTGNLPNFCS